MFSYQKFAAPGYTALFSRRRGARMRIVFTLLASTAILSSLWYAYEIYRGRRWNYLWAHPVVFNTPSGQPPPLYKDIFEYEDSLPQHNKSLPYPEGEHGTYFYPANHVWGLGLNNVLQELILLAYLAYASNRALVFDPYTWHWDDSQDFSEDKEHYSDGEGDMVPSRIPLNAFLSGPIAGGPFENVDHKVPRAVNRKYYLEVCPEPEIIDSAEINKDFDGETRADVMMDVWLERLNRGDRCVQMKKGSDQIFNFYVFGHARVLAIWTGLSQSPILKQWGWSPLVYSAISENTDLLVPNDVVSDHFKTIASSSEKGSDPLSPIPGLLAVHIRRGDYERHCKNLADWSAGFNGFNQFESLLDRFEVPSGGGWGDNTKDNYGIYALHCYPTIEQIVEKIAKVREDATAMAATLSEETASGYSLKKLFIMTNGEHGWIEELKNSLREMGGWETVVASNDLRLTWDQKFIGQAIDMAIGQKAEYFIGNGFSSMTSNLVTLRMAKEMPAYSTRFW